MLGWHAGLSMNRIKTGWNKSKSFALNPHACFSKQAPAWARRAFFAHKYLDRAVWARRSLSDQAVRSTCLHAAYKIIICTGLLLSAALSSCGGPSVQWRKGWCWKQDQCLLCLFFYSPFHLNLSPVKWTEVYLKGASGMRLSSLSVSMLGFVRFSWEIVFWLILLLLWWW